MKKLSYLIVLLLFSCEPLYAGEFTTSITHDFRSEEGNPVRENGKLSVNYNTRKAWADGSIGYDKLQDISESFLGAGYKYKSSDVMDWSGGFIWQHTPDEDSYLASIRVRCWKRLVLLYQPYLNHVDRYIAKVSIAAPSDLGFSLVYGMEYRSEGRIIMNHFGVEF